ncbi:MAG: hypothetical protein Q7K37_03590 [Dehalococcoidia bacterium]|nr:hypothetical protein [Dehalococcoidia bacterium]
MKRAIIVLGSLAFGLVALACSSGGTPGTATPALGVTGTPGAATTPAASDATFAFPTGPAVVVEAGYAPPEDRVPSTGAFLPANGKPTLVYVDAIW